MKKLWIVFFLLIACASCTNQSADKLVLPTRVHTPTQTATLVPSATPTALAFTTDHDGQTEPYPELEVITAENMHRLEEVDMWGQGTVMGIALSPDASTIAVSTPTGIYFYDADSMEQIDWIDFAFPQYDTGLMRPYWTCDNLDYSPDGNSLLIGFTDLFIIDLDTRAIHQFEMTETDIYRPYVMELTYSKDGMHILVNRVSENSGFRDMLFEIYELKSNTVMFQYDFNLYNADARIFLVDDYYATIHQIKVDVNSGQIVDKVEPFIVDAGEHMIIYEQLQDDQWQVTLPQNNLTCKFDGDNILGNMSDFTEDQLTWIVFDGRNTSELSVLHFDSCTKSEQVLFFPEVFGEFNISVDGNYVSTTNQWANYKALWDVNTGEAIAYQEIAEVLSDSAISAEFITTKNSTISIPSILDYAEIEDYQLGNTGQYVVFYGQKEFLVWDFVAGQPLEINEEIEKGNIKVIVFFPDDELLLIREGPYGGGKISIYDLKTEQAVYDFIPSKILSLGPQISPDGKFLAFLANDGTIRIYGVKSEQAGDLP